MFDHFHPYEPFIPKAATKLIVGTMPPPRFSTGELKSRDVDFCYGSQDGQLWPILDAIFNLQLEYKPSQKAIEQRKKFLNQRGLGICDMVHSAKREKMDASDVGMKSVVLRDLISILETHPKIHTLLFTGGNSKNGPEYFFRQHLKANNLRLTIKSEEVPRIHYFELPTSGRTIKTISLTAPSGAANRAVGSMDAYKCMKQKNPEFNTIDFRIHQYRPYF